MTESNGVKYFSQSELWNKPSVDEQVSVADDIISMIPQDVSSILDAGCGNGVVVNRLNKDWDVYGCDLSEVALQQVRVKRAVADISKLPYQDNAFDLVISSDVIEHIPDDFYQKALLELTRIAKRYILIAVPFNELLKAAEVICPNCDHLYHAHLHQRRYSINHLPDLFYGTFGIKKIKFSGERWLHFDENIITLKKHLTGVDYSFENALCPKCNTRRGNVVFTPVIQELERRFNCFEAMLSQNGLQPLPNRSEVLILFERDIHSIEINIDFEQYLKPYNFNEINFDLLVPQQNILNYPDTIKCINDGDDYLILALPFLPSTLKIKEGQCNSIEIYDAVKEYYLSCEYLSENQLNVPQVPNDARGSLLRISGHTRDLILIPEYNFKRTKEEIVSLCFSEDRQTKRIEELLQKLQESVRLANELELKRSNLDKEVLLLRNINKSRAQRLKAKIFKFQEKNNKLNSLRKVIIGSIFSHSIKFMQNFYHQAKDYFYRIKSNESQLNKEVLALSGVNENQAGILNKEALNLNEINSKVTNHLPLELKTININQQKIADKKQGKAILVISHMYPREYNQVGGIFVHEQVKALRNKGIDARVLTGEPYWVSTFRPLKMIRALIDWKRRPIEDWKEYDGVPILKFPYIVGKFLPFQLHAHTYTLGISRYAKKIYNLFPFDLIHAHTSYLDGSAANKLSSIYKVPYVITEHTGPFDVLTKTAYLRKKTTQSIKSSSQLIAVSASLLGDMQRQINSINYKKAIVIPNVVNTEKFTPLAKKNSDLIYMLWIGHFVPIKRVPVLLEAMAMALKSVPQLRLKLVGSGEGEFEARQLCKQFGIESYVEFLGPAARGELAAIYGESDFLVISSKLETFGVVAIEALSCGRPVLATNCGGPAEIITDESLGQIVGMSAKELANGICEMVSRIDDFNPNLIRRAAELRFSYEKISEQLDCIYDTLLYSHSSSLD